MAYLPTVEFGPGMTSATEIRTAWPTLNEKRKTALVMSLYPRTQSNPKLANTVVKLLDTAISSELDEDLSRRGFLKGAGAAAMAGAAGSAMAQSRPVDVSREFQNMRQDDPRVQHNKDIEEMARAIYEQIVATRGQPIDRRQQQMWMTIAREKATEKLSKYAPGRPAPQSQSSRFPAQGSERRVSRNIDNFESQGVAEGSTEAAMSNAVTFFRGEPILSQERLNQLKSSIGKPYPILRKEGSAANIGTYMSPDGKKATSFVQQALAGQGTGGTVTQIQVDPNSFSKGDGGIDEAVIITNIAGLVSDQKPNENDPLRIQDRKQAMLKYLGPGVQKYLNDPLLTNPNLVQRWYNPEFAQKNWNTINSGKQAVTKPGESEIQERMISVLGSLAEKIRRDPEVISYFIGHNPGNWIEYNFRMNSDGSGTKVVDVKYYPPAKSGVAEGSSESVSFRDMVNVVDEHYPKYYAELSGSDISDKQFERAIVNAYKKIMQKQGVAENFADGRNPQDKGDAKRHGINTKASVSSLRKTAKQGGRKGQLAHWLANMKAGRAKNEDVDSDYIEEKWSAKYKSSINCADPKGFSQKAHCAGRKK
jgi:hypothetical protein